jgi:hypothetical protein
VNVVLDRAHPRTTSKRILRVFMALAAFLPLLANRELCFENRRAGVAKQARPRPSFSPHGRSLALLNACHHRPCPGCFGDTSSTKLLSTFTNDRRARVPEARERARRRPNDLIAVGAHGIHNQELLEHKLHCGQAVMRRGCTKFRVHVLYSIFLPESRRSNSGQCLTQYG